MFICEHRSSSGETMVRSEWTLAVVALGLLWCNCFIRPHCHFRINCGNVETKLGPNNTLFSLQVARQDG